MADTNQGLIEDGDGDATSNYTATGTAPAAAQKPLRIPVDTPPELKTWLRRAKDLTPVRDEELAKIQTQIESYEPEIQKLYKPKAAKDEWWRLTRDLMLHMNTTQIALRSLAAVYSGAKNREVTGNGEYVKELNEFANTPDFDNAMMLHFLNHCSFGTSCVSPFFDDEIEQLRAVIHNPVRTHIFTDDANVWRTLGIAEFSENMSFMRFATRNGAGLLRAGALPNDGEFVAYSESLPYLLTSIAYSDDRRPLGEKYGRPLLRPTVGFNRILTNAYFCLGLLIKWQSRSLLTICSGDGGDAAIPKKFRQIQGNTAVMLEKDGKAEFISPNAKFDEILKVINSYLSFLSVLLGLPKSVFTPTENQSAQAARLEGAPMVSTHRKMARNSESNEVDFLTRCAAYLHLKNKSVAVPMKTLREKYKISVTIDPWDYTEDIVSTGTTLINLVNNGLMRARDAIKKVNRNLTEEQVEALIAEAQEKAAKALLVDPNPPDPEPVKQAA